jgi:hypothetical protein
MEQSTEQLAAQIRGLATGVGSLSETLSNLDERVHTVVAQEKRTKRNVRWTIAIAALDLLLTVGVSWTIYSQTQSTDRLEAVVARQDDERRIVHCPFYALVLGSYNPSSRKEGPDRVAYEAAFVQMRKSYEYLDCGPVVPPAAPR